MIPSTTNSVLDTECLRRAIGQVLTQHRVDSGLGQRAFARMTGFDNSHIRKLEAGELNLSLNTLVKLASALDTTPAGLLQEAQDHLTRP